MLDDEVVHRTLVFASQKHTGQMRDGGRGVPYINHPIEVEHWVALAGGSLVARCAAILHDVIEDAHAKDEEILELYADDPVFGQEVLTVVKEHTDPPGITSDAAKEREIALMTSGQYLEDTRLVIEADQLSNMLDIVRGPPNWGNGEEQRYILLVERLVDASRGTSTFLEAELDKAIAKAKAFYGMS